MKFIKKTNLWTFICLCGLVIGLLYYRSHTISSPITIDNFKEKLPDRYKKSQQGPDRRPSDWAWLQRTYPYYTADKTAVVDAIKSMQVMKKAMPVSHGSSATQKLTARQWQFVGPANIGGRISDIEYDPRYPHVLYAGASTGGVFKSWDGGWTWAPVFDDQAILSVGDIAVDPNNTQIIYVGTGEANGGHNNFPGGGIFKSIDGGLSWQSIGLEKTISIGRIVIDPNNSNRIFVAAIGSYFGPDPDRGVYLSENGGITWEKSLFVNDSTGAIDIIMNPDNPDVLHAAVWERIRRPEESHLYGPSSGIYRSIDGGDSWRKLTAVNGLPENDLFIGRIGLALCLSQPNVIYALYTDYTASYGYDYRALYRSDDEGITWNKVDPNRRIRQGTGGFSWYFGNVRVNPDNPDQVFVLDVAFMRSDDGGMNWPVIYGYGNPYYDFHVDHHALAFHPTDPGAIIDGNDGGINISSNLGNSWSKVPLLPVTQFYEITVDQTNEFGYYGGTQDNGTLRTLTGNSNDWEEIYGGDGFFVIVDPVNPSIIYAESQYGYLGKSTNGGRYFNSALSGINLTEPTNWSTPVVMDPNTHTILYYGTNRIYRTINSASSWAAISPDLSRQIPESRMGTITTIAVAPCNSNVIYAGTDDGNVWVSDDYGNIWQNITNDLPLRWVTRIAVDPANEAIAYVTFSGLKWKSAQPHIFRTTNFGQTWIDISGNLPDAPINIAMVDAFHSNLIYVGNDVGCFFSADSGFSWNVLGQGLPIVPVYSMDIHKATRKLLIGTHGRSMYTLDLSDLVPVEQSVFELITSNDEVTLRWQTESEISNLGFSVEHGIDGVHFSELTFIKGMGTTSQTQYYEYTHKFPRSGINYYRLKQIDYNGSYRYSDVLKTEVKTPDAFRLMQNYPNPFNSSTTIEYVIKKPGMVSLTIVNNTGQVVRNLVSIPQAAGRYQIVWDGRDESRNELASGIYVYRLKTADFISSRRAIYLK